MTDIDLDAPRLFYDPHPGRAGAAIPIPSAVKAAAEAMDGMTLPLSAALRAFRLLGIGTIDVVPEHSYISLRIGGNGRPEHCFRVIRYR